MKKDYYRSWQFFLFIISLGVLLASFYFQWVNELQPCPLCIMQRICVAFALVLFTMGAALGRTRAAGLLTLLQCLIALAGLYFASRQVWLQSLPPEQLPACLPGLDVLLRYFPWRDVLRSLIWGAADCAEVNWQWLGLSMPGWCVMYFTGLLIAVPISRLFLNQHEANKNKFW